ncbi:MAG: doubled motif LPXTG anchor domain-containing protein, partial [Oscillospiraceae bacterium]|nr:doubled motif LPXTG anchor domain-containing protein [Oscillospiraceae bacterium]
PNPVPDPDPEEPIEDPEIPLDELPEEPVEIDEPEIPLEELPEIIDIDDPDVPLSDVPQTGDISFLWYGAVVVSVMGLVGLSLLERKKRQEGQES